jgi:hypothetical protein
MTTERYHRCKHCGDEYIYQASGAYSPDYNHSDWCNDCYKAVCDALRARPRLYECRYQNIREAPKFEGVGLETVLGWEVENTKEQTARDMGPKDSMGFYVRRVFSPLFDLKTGDSTTTREIVGRGKFQGAKFLLMTWRQKPEYEITSPMEYDIQKGCFTGHSWPR